MGDFCNKRTGTFVGRIDPVTLLPLYRAIAQADTEGILAEGDYRE